MGNNNGYLTVGEFERAMQAQNTMLRDGFSEVRERLNDVCEKQDTHSERIAVLETNHKFHHATPVKTKVAWGSIGAGAAAVVAIVKGFFTYVK